MSALSLSESLDLNSTQDWNWTMMLLSSENGNFADLDSLRREECIHSKSNAFYYLVLCEVVSTASSMFCLRTGKNVTQLTAHNTVAAL
jgi:hypothetical protein